MFRNAINKLVWLHLYIYICYTPLSYITEQKIVNYWAAAEYHFFGAHSLRKARALGRLHKRSQGLLDDLDATLASLLHQQNKCYPEDVYLSISKLHFEATQI